MSADIRVPRAVVFDFYGTLTVSATKGARRSGSDRVADALGVPREAFWDAMSSTFADRARGTFGDLATTIGAVANLCGVSPDPPTLAAAAELRLAEQREFLIMLRTEVSDVLTALRSRFIRIGVLSDCTHELPRYWGDLDVAPLVDATLFSVEYGEKKPDPAVYLEICRRLGVDPSETWYVGDGGSNELTGAAGVGMETFHLVAADGSDALVYDRDLDWQGPTLATLSELVDILDQVESCS